MRSVFLVGLVIAVPSVYGAPSGQSNADDVRIVEGVPIGGLRTRFEQLREDRRRVRARRALDAAPEEPKGDLPGVLPEETGETEDTVMVDFVVQTKSAAATERLCSKGSKGSKGRFVCTDRMHTALEGVVVETTVEDLAKALKKTRSGDVIVADAGTYMFADMMTQVGAAWGLSSVDSSATDDTYVYPSSSGAGTTVWVLDTGVDCNHNDFDDCCQAYDTYQSGSKVCSSCDGSCATDRDGHGTHCAGTVGGTLYGVAKNTHIKGVKVLSDNGSGSTTSIITAVDYVAANQDQGEANIISMSLGGGGMSDTFAAAITGATNAGVLVVSAAGNANQDACTHYPSAYDDSMSIGSIASTFARSSFSNYGSCVSMFAPGSGIISARAGTTDGTRTISGTSMATPHVAGAAAVFAAMNPALNARELRAMVENAAATNQLTDVRGSPNLMLKVPFADDGVVGRDCVESDCAPVVDEVCDQDDFVSRTTTVCNVEVVGYAPGQLCLNGQVSTTVIGTCADMENSPTATAFWAVGDNRWVDSDGQPYDCGWYGGESTRCSQYGDSFANGGRTANVACRACGGGVITRSGPVDCVVGWGEWGACTATQCGDPGTRSRSQIVITQPSDGGQPCPELQVESQACDAPCPCVYEWGDWTCDAQCDGVRETVPGTETRSPIITAQPTDGGEPCPDPETRSCQVTGCPVTTPQNCCSSCRRSKCRTCYIGTSYRSGKTCRNNFRCTAADQC